MSHLTPIFAVWDHNAEAMAAAIGEPGVKVRQWRNRGNIPSRYWPRIIAEAKKKRAKPDMSQFIPPAVLTVCTCARLAAQPVVAACPTRASRLRHKAAARPSGGSGTRVQRR